MNTDPGQGSHLLLEIPKKHVHSVTHFCRNNHYKFRFENMHSLPQEKVAKFSFREPQYYAAAMSFLNRLLDLDRIQPEETETPHKKGDRPQKPGRQQRDH